MYKITAYLGDQRFPTLRLQGFTKAQAIKEYRKKYNLKGKRIDLIVEQAQFI